MSGLAQPIELRQPRGESVASMHLGFGEGANVPPTSLVIGVICAGDLAIHRDTVKQALKRGMEQRPDSVWVCIEPKSDRLTHDLMISLGIEPVVLPMGSEWRRDRHRFVNWHTVWDGDNSDAWPETERETLYDFRRVWRDLEMLTLCDELIVFHKRSGNSPWRDRAASGLYADRLVVVELGKPKAKK